MQSLFYTFIKKKNIISPDF